ncbi:Spy/CpxP family protein refolding chaperone [Sulfurimonas sp. HSL-3221]|uniref:Spy/CpxP family protein refolding chaperone n=1 Tax=Sulfurimonadaceae TaxID=2771471 RepID=UPI001E65520C|nr:Spy/CpxP family protein refolding chaperone [Sulfurimonas sp. HSL-3221]UFS63071.1 Spy/CpxP family protein refolding chaperone [Sulfurimonas sp. HSL-3221]
MKRTLLIGALLAAAGTSAFAGPHGGDRMLFNSLDLTTAQKQQLKTIRKEARDERFKLRDQMDDLRDKTNDRILAVLTEDQKKAYIAARSDRMQQRMDKRCDRDKMPMKRPKYD